MHYDTVLLSIAKKIMLATVKAIAWPKLHLTSIKEQSLNSGNESMLREEVSILIVKVLESEIMAEMLPVSDRYL